MVTFDCGDLARLGDLETNAKAADELIVVDHHASNERYGTINVIDVNAAASGVLVRRLIAELGLPAHPRRRDLPLRRVGLRHRSLPVRVHHVRGVRARAGARRVRPARSRRSRARCSRSTASRTSSSSPTCWAGAELVPDKQFVWAKVTQADLERRGVTFEEVEGHDRPRAPHARGRGLVRAEGSRRRRVAGQPALARRGRRVPHRRSAKAAAVTGSRPASRATTPPKSSCSASSPRCSGSPGLAPRH